ncbi:MAG: hypothetical protein C0600_16675 [Ignavibacteria bacterium]|nr:MAG: hypothetical protein C0600_16675 [Ignavibacteria bacterium]
MSLTSVEQSAIDSFRRGKSPRQTPGAAEQDRLQFGIWALLKSARIVRDQRMHVGAVARTEKADGSMVTSIEHQIECLIEDHLYTVFPEVSFVGEESGNELPEGGTALAIDPIDGTWSFLAHAESCSTTLTWYDDGRPTLGMIINHATGELAYAFEHQRTRLIQLSLFGEADQGTDLKPHGSTAEKCLVNIHPARSADDLLAALYAAWRREELRNVRALGGSPVWSMLDAAKGHYLYVNNWGGGAASSYDLAAGILLLRGAGGEVIDLQGDAIDMVGHRGIFIAGLDSTCRNNVLRILQRARADQQDPGALI